MPDASAETAPERYDVLVDELLAALRPGFGGSSSPDFVAKISRLTREIEREGDHSYIREKAGSVRNWVEIACSPRKHKPWGLEKVEHFAFEDAYRLKGTKGMFNTSAGE